MSQRSGDGVGGSGGSLASGSCVVRLELGKQVAYFRDKEQVAYFRDCAQSTEKHQSNEWRKSDTMEMLFH